MKILITAGGTSEKIDEVRYITNHATGGLGAMLAQAFLNDAAHEITYLHGRNALLPSGEGLTLVPIDSVNHLLKTMTQLLATEKFDVVIHSMAVSDYQLNAALSQEDLARALAAQLQRTPRLDLTDLESLTATLNGYLSGTLANSRPVAKKISSNSTNLILALGASAKVINIIKKFQPETILVGFKLLVDVTEEELTAVAQQTLVKNQADFVLANDLTTVGPVNHHAFLLDSDNHKTYFKTKADIAAGIKAAVIDKYRG